MAILGRCDQLGMQPYLQKLELVSVGIGKNECMDMAGLLCSSTTNVHTLDLSDNGIDDEVVDALMGVFTDGRLTFLNLSANRVTAKTKGCQRLAVLLQSPNFERLNLYGNNIGDEGALVFC